MIDWDTQVHGAIGAVFGEPALYQSGNGAPYPVTVIYDEAFLITDPAGGYGVQTAMPVAGAQVSQFQTPPQQNDRLTIQRTGEQFVVREPKPDGHGWCLLLLNLVGGGP